MKTNLILSILLLLCSNFLAQENYFHLASKQNQIRNYQASNDLYKKALETSDKRSTTSLIHYRMGQNYEELLDFEMAFYHFKKSFQKGRLYKKVILDMARCKRKNGQYDQSTKYAKKYIRREKYDQEGRRMLEANQLALTLISNPTAHKVELNRDLSSPFYDFSPHFINANKTMLMISSSRNYADSVIGVGKYFNMHYSKLSDNKWTTPIALDTSKITGNNASVSFDTKRNKVFFTSCQNGENCTIHYSFLKGDLMGKSIPISFNDIDTKNNTLGHPFYSNELEILFFSSDLDGGEGKFDIWYSEYIPETDGWKKPVNLGPGINTPQNEYFPTLSANGDLFFSSKGRLTLGGFDIFKSSKSPEHGWNYAENMGYPINSAGDDFGLVFNNDGKSGYYTSDRQGGLGKDDIYNFSFDNTFNLNQVSDSSNLLEETHITALNEIFNKPSCESLKDSLIISKGKVYPNPSSGQFKLTFTSSIESELTIKIFSSLGKLISNKTESIPAGETTKDFDLSNQDRGIYYVHINENCTTIYSKKIIIQ